MRTFRNEPGSFIDSLEKMEEDLAEWAAEYDRSVFKALAPDGRPFGMKKQSEREKLKEYMELRGNPTAWLEFMDQLIAQAHQALDGIPDEEKAGIDPIALVHAYCLGYSRKMEALAEKEQTKAEDAAPRLSAFQLPAPQEEESTVMDMETEEETDYA